LFRYLDLLIAIFICWKFNHHVILFCLQSLILNIVLFPPKFCLWICACVFTLFGPCTPWGGTLTIGLLSLSAHFDNGCQWGRSFEGLKGIRLHALVLFLSICLACFAWLSIYSGNSTNNIGWQYMQWNSSSFTRA
jgi:hypothetical protein